MKQLVSGICAVLAGISIGGGVATSSLMLIVAGAGLYWLGVSIGKAFAKK